MHVVSSLSLKDVKIDPHHNNECHMRGTEFNTKVKASLELNIQATWHKAATLAERTTGLANIDARCSGCRTECTNAAVDFNDRKGKG